MKDPSDTTASDRQVAACREKQDRLPPEGFLRALREVKRPFIVAHVTPDSDAIGAILALTATFRAHDIEATAGLPTASLAQKLQFMLELAPDTPFADRWDPNGPYDALIVLDTANQKRINITPAPDINGDLPVFNIDHHTTNTAFGRCNWVDGLATSTCELIARLIAALGWTPSPNCASLLYAGIHGDTAGFSLSSSSAGALQTAAGLLDAGADVALVGEALCRSQSRSEFELLRLVYDHTTVIDGGRIAYSHLSYQDISGAGCQPDDIDDQVSIPRSLKGVRIALLFTEGERDVIRVNLRGEGDVTVVEIAKKLGGGGHNQAAGIRFHDKTMEEAIDLVCKEAVEHLKTFEE